MYDNVQKKKRKSGEQREGELIPLGEGGVKQSTEKQDEAEKKAKFITPGVLNVCNGRGGCVRS